MESELQSILKSVEAVERVCYGSHDSVPVIRTRGVTPNLNLPPDPWPLIPRHVQCDQREKLSMEIIHAAERYRRICLEGFDTVIASTRSLEHFGVPDSDVEWQLSRVFEGRYRKYIQEIEERVLKHVRSGDHIGDSAQATFPRAAYQTLEAAYERSHNLTAREVALVSDLSGLSQAQFQNRRARARKIAEKEKRQQEEEARQDVNSSEPTLERRPVAALPKRVGKKGARQTKASTSAPSLDSADPPAADKPRAVKGLPKRGKKDAPKKPAVTIPSQVPPQDKAQQRSLAPARSFSASTDWSSTSISSLESALHPASSTAVSDMISSVASSETAVSTKEGQVMMGPGWNGPMISLPMPNGETPSFNFVPPTPAKADFTPWALPEDFAAAYGTGVDLSSFSMPGFDGSHVGQMMQDAAWQETSLEDMFAMLNEYTPQDYSAFESALALGASVSHGNASSTLSPNDHSQAAASPATTTSEDQAEDAFVNQLIAKWASEPYHLDPPSGPESISGPSSPDGFTPNSRPASFIENAFLPLDFSSFAGPSADIGEISSEWSVEIPPPNAEGDALLREADEWLRFSPSPSPQPQQLPDSSHSGSPASSMSHTPSSRHAGLMDINMPGLVIQDGMGNVDPRYIPLPASPKMGPKDVVGEWVAGVLPFDLDEKAGWSLEPVAWTPLQ